MGNKSTRERQRFAVTLPLWVRLRQWKRTRTQSKKEAAASEVTHTENISSAGCYFSLSRKPSLGARAEMELTVPGRYVGLQDGKVRCSGKIVRVDRLPGNGKFGVACSIDRFGFLNPK